jgi:5-methylthioadenosine/S-adenosylhomocysteine deaminase
MAQKKETPANIDSLIHDADYVVTMNKDREILKKGAVAVHKGKILEVGKSRDLVKKYTNVNNKIRARDRLVMPGLINAHMHSTQQLARGLADCVFLPTWIHDRLFPWENALSAEEVYLSSMACCIELIRTGTTTFDDPGGYNMHMAVKAVTEAGLRANLKRSVTDIHATGRPLPPKMKEGTRKGLKAGEEFVKKYNGAANGRISAWFSCRTERMSSNDLLAETTELCKKYGVGFGTHMVSNPDSVNRHKEVHHGKKAVVRYHEAGALGPHLITYHTNSIDEEELELLDEYDVGVVHCPTASFAGAYGSFSQGFHPEMFARGMKHGLGCDTAPESNFVDMFRVMFAVTAHRDFRMDATLFPPEHILEMATLGSARAMNMEKQVGSLEMGKKADLIMLDITRPEWIPHHNIISNIVQSSSGDTVDFMMVDGEVIYQDRQIKTVDEKALLQAANKAGLAVAKRTGLDYFGLSPWPMR